MKAVPFTTLLVAAVLVLAPLANADTQSFTVQWSGALDPNPNGAMATAIVSLDPTLVNNPGETTNSTTPFISDFTLTITGATAGNGTFNFSDFSDFYLNTGGATLDFTRELIGQPTTGAPFGTEGGSGGAFSIYGNLVPGNPGSAGPNGGQYFAFSPNNGSDGESLFITSFAPTPSTATPEPASVLYCSLGSAVCAVMVLRKRRLQASDFRA